MSTRRNRVPSLKLRQIAQESSKPSTSTASSSSTTPSRTSSRTSARRGRSAKTTPATSTKERKPRRKPWEDDDGTIYSRNVDVASDSSTSSEDEDFRLAYDEEELADEDISTDCINQEDDTMLFCPWIELKADSYPALVLPPSSEDLRLPAEHIMDAVEIYEILRSYHRTLRLSPFCFEDFCAALTSSENSCILSEVHIALMKICLKADDEDQVHYSTNETNSAFNIMVVLMESMTYAEVIRQYLEAVSSTPNLVPQEVLEAINTSNYPFVDVTTRLTVITYLCYRFLGSSEFRKLLINGGKPPTEDVCRMCTRAGDLLNCDWCSAAVHLQCLSTAAAEKTKKEEDMPWICPLCRKNEVKGVSDCLPLQQTAERQPFRMVPLGRDRHGRIYWFVARRFFVQEEDESDLHYYSTPLQLYSLFSLFDPHTLEYQLCKTICEHLDVIFEQMSITVELTLNGKDAANKELYEKRKPYFTDAYISADNVFNMAQILSEAKAKREEIISQDIKFDDMTYVPLPERMYVPLGITEGALTSAFWTGGKEESDVLAGFVPVRPSSSGLFVHGDSEVDPTFRLYRNQYSADELGIADGVLSRKKRDDKKKYLSTKFCLIEEGNGAFEWSVAKGRGMYGNDRLHAKYLEWTIGKMLRKLPREVFHREWSKHSEILKQDLSKAETYEELSMCLLRAEAAMRKTLFIPQWWNSLGVTRLTRTTIDDREAVSKDLQKRKKKDDKDRHNFDGDEEDLIRVKYTRVTPNIALYKLKDETYRLSGRGALGGWLWVSSKMKRDIRETPLVPASEEGEVGPAPEPEKMKKIRRLEAVTSRLRGWREEEERIVSNITRCYSPSCPSRGGSNSLSSTHVCYSWRCRSGTTDTVSTARVVKARDVGAVRTPKPRLGLDVPFPFPRPHNFISPSTGKYNILVVNPVVLRRLCVTGGVIPFHVPNFSMSAKSNLKYWNYPCPRPCFDWCWKWLTSNARSLHAVSLQLRIIWACIKWLELEPSSDEENDGRVITHLLDKAELRRVVDHKEFPPLGTYERYVIEIETVPLNDDDDDEGDVSWSGRSSDAKRNLRKRKNPERRPKRIPSRRIFREEWIDGVELKVFEIISYWQEYIDAMLKEEQAALSVLQPQQVTRKKSPAVQSRSSTINIGTEVLTNTETGLPLQYRKTKRPPPINNVTDVEYVSGDSFVPLPSRKRPYPRKSTQNKSDFPVWHENQPSPSRRTATGYEYHGGQIRGGGRNPVGDGHLGAQQVPMRRVVVSNAGLPQSVAAEETVISSPGPASGTMMSTRPIQRVGGPHDDSYDGSTRVQSAARLINQGGETAQRLNNSGKTVVLVRKPEGGGTYMNRIPRPMEATRSADGQSLIVIKQNGQQLRRVVTSVRRPVMNRNDHGGNYVRVQGGNGVAAGTRVMRPYITEDQYGQRVQPSDNFAYVRRAAPPMVGQYAEVESEPANSVVLDHGYRNSATPAVRIQPVSYGQRLLTRGGSTIRQFAQPQVSSEYGRNEDLVVYESSNLSPEPRGADYPDSLEAYKATQSIQ